MHKGFLEWKKALKEGLDVPQLFGHCQWIYSSKKGVISLIHVNILSERNFVFEIYCLKGELFEGIERFSTKEKAEESIRNYLS